VVFATETLALGINMPARTVVIESLMKFTGEKHEMMTPGEYTQLSGRAGRRGIDEVGHSIVLLQRFTPFDAVSRLASTRTYPLVSSFRPSYNMAVNLVRNYTRGEAEHLVNSSFAQFQADRDVVRMERARESSAAYLASYRERMTCDKGDFFEYWEFVKKRRNAAVHGSSGLERNRKTIDGIGRLRRGDVIEIPSGKKKGRYAVIEVSQSRSERRPKVLALSESGTMQRFAPTDFSEPPSAIATLRLPKSFHMNNGRSRRDVAQQLRTAEATRSRAHPERSAARLTDADKRVEEHPCHECPELKRHIHFAERADRLEKETAGYDRRIKRRTGTLARRFEQVLGVLESLEYVDHWLLTERGERLTRVYNESDLLVVEALEVDLFTGLDPAELAAVCSSLVYEARGPDLGIVGEMPTKASDSVWKGLMKLWRQIRREEESRSLELTREPDPGFAVKAHMWASGKPLEIVLEEDDAPGDFVRSVKQLIDLLRQLEEVAPSKELAACVSEAIAGLSRGVVAYSSVAL
jgi:ATP-dependent RNA helicase HelY